MSKTSTRVRGAGSGQLVPSDEAAQRAQTTETVKVKVIGIKEGKISLTIKGLLEPTEEVYEKVDLPKAENIGTNLADLFKNIKL